MSSPWPQWPTHGRVAIDLESNDPKLRQLGPGWRRGAYICGVAVAIQDGPSGYLATAHAGGGNVDNPEQVWAYLRDQAKHFRGELVGANITYDLDGLRTLHGADFRHAKVCDVQVAAKLIDTAYFDAGPWGAPGYTMNQILKRAGLPQKAEEAMLEAWSKHPASQTKTGKLRAGWEKLLKASMWRLHADDVEAYAIWDAEATLELLAKYGPDLPAGPWALEQDVTKMLLDLRCRGMRVDEQYLEAVTATLEQDVADTSNRLSELCGTPVSALSSADLQPHLDRAGLVYRLTPTGKPKIDSEWLNDQGENPLAVAIRNCRDAGKMLSMAKSLPKHMVDGRIHAELKQFGAATGRMSCANPNLQQAPSRKAVAKQWRKLFIPEEGMRFFSCDFSSQEPRWIAHWASVAGLDTFAAAYRADPRLDNHTLVAEMAGIARPHAKTLNLGKAYGMGGAKLCRSLGLPTGGWKAIGTRDSYETRGEAMKAYQRALASGDVPSDWDGPKVWECAGPEGQAIIRAYDEKFPAMKFAAHALARSAREQGAVWTWTDRRIACRFGHKALNYICQGSAGDHTKRAAVDVWQECPEALISMLVHDEIVGSVPDPLTARRVADIMERPHSELVPHVVDPATGDTWADCK